MLRTLKPISKRERCPIRYRGMDTRDAITERENQENKTGVDCIPVDLLKELKKKFPHGHEKFYELILDICQMHSDKNHDYSKNGDPLSNLRMSEEIGVPAWKGTLIRMGDKWSRLTQLALKDAKIHESVIDNFKDMAIYSLLNCILYGEWLKWDTKSKEQS